METYRETIISGAPINEIKSFLESTANQRNGQKYYCNDCEMKVVRTWFEKMGSIHFQRTEISFSGKKDAVLYYTKLFRLKFLSAGG